MKNTKLDQYRPPSQDKRHEDDLPEDEDVGDFEEKDKRKEESGKNLSINRDKGMSLTPDISPKSSQAGREEEEKSKEYVSEKPFAVKDLEEHSWIIFWSAIFLVLSGCALRLHRQIQEPLLCMSDWDSHICNMLK